MMENRTELFKDIYLPKKALVIYQSEQDEKNVYVEAYDMNRQGKPINAHPLSLAETAALAQCLQTSPELSNDYTRCEGLIPEKVLYIHPHKGYAIWHTPAGQVDMLFKEDLRIPSGKAFVPPLLWKADKQSLHLYAMGNHRKPTIHTALFHAPFFNMHDTGLVCMGTVDIDMQDIHSLEAFMKQWEHYYWNSYFSHLIADVSPVAGNIVQLWQNQVSTGNKFPLEVLKKNGKTIKDLIV